MTKANETATSSFWTLFNDLRTTRSSHESLNTDSALLACKTGQLEQLHNMRAELAVAKQGVGL